MDSDLEDIKKLDSILFNPETVEATKNEDASFTYCISDDEVSEDDDDIEEYKAIPLDYDKEVTELLPCSSTTTKLSLGHGYTNIKNIKLFLTQEELNEIEECPNPDLQNIMVINRTKMLKLKNLKLHYSNLLHKCHNAITEAENKNVKKACKRKLFRTLAIRTGYPYFKDNKLFIAPLHSEAKQKISRGEISPYNIPNYGKWTLDDQSMLKASIAINYKKQRIQKLEDEVERLRKQIDSIDDKDTETIESINILIENKTNMIDLLHDATINDIPPIEYDDLDWNKISEELRVRHSSVACRSFWKVYLHPSINKSPLSAEEERKFKTLIEKYKHQNWEKIAEELGTNRSPFSLCVYYFSKLHNKFNYNRFTEEEDRRVLELVNKYKIGKHISWNRIALEFQERSKYQIYHRYKYYLLNAHTIKGSFTDAEDIMLFCLYKKYGSNYKEYTNHIPHRSDSQIRYRMTNYIDSQMSHKGNWSYEEDKIIMNYVEEQGSRKWAQLQQKLHRNRYHIRHRWLSLKNWMNLCPGKDIKDMPRRHHMIWTNQRRKPLVIQKIADEFGDKLPTLKEIEDYISNKEPMRVKLKRGEWLDCNVADMQLIDYFRKRHQKKKNKMSTPSCQFSSSDSAQIKSLIKLFNVNLKIPSDEDLCSNSNLDEIDLKILEEIKSDESLRNFDVFSEPEPSTSSVVKIYGRSTKPQVLSPMLNTLITLRDLLIKHKLYKNSIPDEIRENWNMDEFLSGQKTGDANIFLDRMKTLFRWPCIMSLNPPSEILKKTGEELKPKKPPPPKLGARQLKKVRREKVLKMVENKKNKKGIVNTKAASISQIDLDIGCQQQNINETLIEPQYPFETIKLDKQLKTSGSSQEMATQNTRGKGKRKITDTPTRESPREPKKKFDEDYVYCFLPSKSIKVAARGVVEKDKSEDPQK